MKKIIITVICLISCIHLFGCCSNSKAYKTNLKRFDKKLYNVKKVDYKFYELYPEVVNLIKNESEIKNLYSENKKFVVYVVGVGCPYGKAFTDAMDKLVKEDNYYKDYYNFYRMPISYGKSFPSVPADDKEAIEKVNKEMQIYRDYMEACGLFSIFNPSTNQVMSLNAVGYDTAEQMKNILDQLLYW